MKTILAIVGSAGVGKDTAANYLAEVNGWNIIHSFTNRPMRDGEINGREHKFVTNSAPENTFAYTHYGNYDYWTEFNQFIDGVNIYVIDEKGVMDAQNKVNEQNEWRLISVYISADSKLRRERGVSEERMERDKTREIYNISYTYRINNNGNINDFYKELDSIKIE